MMMTMMTTTIGKRINVVVSTHEGRGFAVKAHPQGAKLVNPGKSSLTGEAQLVDNGVEQALASAFRGRLCKQSGSLQAVPQLRGKFAVQCSRICSVKRLVHQQDEVEGLLR
jgi:hypothetical protein